MDLRESAKIAILLTGGRSRRMGADKSMLEINGLPQWQFMLNELSPYFDDVYISCRAEQQLLFPDQHCILDRTEDIGPIGALESAFLALPEYNSLFFVACDLPNFKISVVKKIYDTLKTESDVCAAKSIDKAFPEPLVALWHRKSLEAIQQAIQTHNFALHRCMKALRVQEVPIEQPEVLLNVNHPRDLIG